MRFRVTFGAVRPVAVPGVMTFAAGDLGMRTLVLHNLFFLINMAGVAALGQNVEINQAADRCMWIGVTGEAFQEGGAMRFAVTGRTPGHDIGPDLAGSEGVESLMAFTTIYLMLTTVVSDIFVDRIVTLRALLGRQGLNLLLIDSDFFQLCGHARRGRFLGYALTLDRLDIRSLVSSLLCGDTSVKDDQQTDNKRLLPFC